MRENPMVGGKVAEYEEYERDAVRAEVERLARPLNCERPIELLVAEMLAEHSLASVVGALAEACDTRAALAYQHDRAPFFAWTKSAIELDHAVTEIRRQDFTDVPAHPRRPVNPPAIRPVAESFFVNRDEAAFNARKPMDQESQS